LSAAELGRLLDTTPERWRLLLQLLAETGLRISEATGLQWRDIDLSGRRLRVRRRRYRGQVEAPKSRFGTRTVPLGAGLAARLAGQRARCPYPSDEHPVFASERGTAHDSSYLYRTALKPAARAADLEWVGFHTLRHTCATLLFTQGGANAKQVQMWLGHHSPAFTLATYVHLLPEDLPNPGFFDALLPQSPASPPDVRGNARGNLRDRDGPRTAAEQLPLILDGKPDHGDLPRPAEVARRDS